MKESPDIADEFRIGLASWRLFIVALILGFFLVGILWYTIEQEHPSSDTAVIQGGLFGLIMYLVCGLASMLFHSTICLVLRFLGKLTRIKYITIQLLFLVIFLVIIVYIFVVIPAERTDLDNSALGIFSLILFCNFVAGIVYWILGTKCVPLIEKR